jgi:hypothetical protein
MKLPISSKIKLNPGIQNFLNESYIRFTLFNPRIAVKDLEILKEYMSKSHWSSKEVPLN